MGLGDLHKQRRLWGVLALAGAMLYAALVPGHIVSQAASQSAADAQAAHAALDKVAAPICPEHASASDDSKSPAPGEPASPKKKCPFCTGYAAFLAATIGGADAGILTADTTPFAFASFDDAFVAAVVGLPQNRGPPFEL